MMCKEVHVAAYQKGKVGNKECGDRYFLKRNNDEFICVIVDGLGSGQIAGESSQAVIDIIQNYPDISDGLFVKKCVEKLIGKRGVVFGMLRLNLIAERYTYSSIGNIGLVRTTGNGQRDRIIPKPGFLASYVRELKIVQGDLQKDMCFLMFSDGVLDQELSQLYLFGEDVDGIVRAFSSISGEEREDDTTLIAIKYTSVV